MTPEAVAIFQYTNHRGETADRRVIPLSLHYQALEPWYPAPCHLLHAYDLDKRAYRHFAMAKIVGWTEEKLDDPGRAAGVSPRPV